MKHSIDTRPFRVAPEEGFKLTDRPTTVEPICNSKKHYKKLLKEHVESLAKLQRLHYASGRYA